MSLFAMPNPLFHLPLGVFPGFIPLMLIIKGSNIWTRLSVNYLFSELFALALLIPLDGAKLSYVFPDTLFLMLLFSIIAFIYAIYFTFAAFLSDKHGWIFAPIIFGIGWLTIQKLLSIIPIAFSFPIETAISGYPVLIQSAGIFGGHFIGALIISTNAAMANIFIEKDRNVRAITFLILAMAHVINIGYGAYSLNLTLSNRCPYTIAIIQPNISIKEYELKGQVSFFKKIIEKRIIDLTREALSKKPKLIIWPELAGDYILQNDLKLASLYDQITSKGTDLLIGTSFMDHQDHTKKNIAFILKRDGDMTEPYIKQRLFPFSESSVYSIGKSSVILPASFGLDIGIMICLESWFPEIAREETRAGANVLVSISTDAAFGNSMVPYVHSAQTIFRAIENDRYAVHLGNCGPSIVCDNKGRILTNIPYGKTAIAFAHIVR